ncbi:MAG: c-type cytochrome [Pseudomonadota bacterium]
MKHLITLIGLLAFAASVHASHNSNESIMERIKPVGELKIMTEEEMEALVAEQEASESDDDASGDDQSGEEVYNANCLACHSAGIAGAPKVGDIPGWTDRIAQGMEVLIAHAIDGYQGSAGVMPAKGGNPALSDAAVTAAVEYMVEQSQ